jgi:hypothetical protein
LRAAGAVPQDGFTQQLAVQPQPGSQSVKPYFAAAVALCASAATWPATAATEPPDAWQFQAMLDLYLPSIGGTTTFPPGSGSSSDVGVDASAILNNLKMAFMGALEARRGPWGMFTDVLYVDLGNTKSGTRALSIGGRPLPVDASASATFDLRGTAWTLAATYRVVPDPQRPLDLIAGARLLDMKETLGWQLSGNLASIPLPVREGNRASSLSNWDALVGAKGQFRFGPDNAWFAHYYLDVGTGESNLTWQAVGGIGYRFNWGEIIGAWRHLDYRMQTGKTIESLSFDGPMIGALFHW